MLIGEDGLVTTIKERCRRCYACVRECPAEAIRIVDGQASVIPSRCIGCANCFRVCSQNAKQAFGEVDRTFDLLASSDTVMAIVAPSFPAEFTDLDESQLVAMMRELGFAAVHEVAFGADLVARAFAKLLARDDGGRYIATPCPAVVSYVRKYHPDLTPSLAPDRLADGRHGARAARPRRCTAPTPRSSSSDPASPRRARRPTPTSSSRSTPC